MVWIIRLIKKIEYIVANRSYSGKVTYLQKYGCKIGKTTRLNCKTDALGTEPYLIEIGEHCLFAGGIHIITHDGGISVLNNLNKFGNARMDKMKRVHIGNNVYIGLGATIMPGVTIGDNVLVGAGAIVTKDIPSNCCAAGVPAKIICSLEEYASRAKESIYSLEGMSLSEKQLYLTKNVK